MTRDEIQAAVCLALAETLECSAGAGLSFMDQGLDSMAAVEMRDRLQPKFGPLPAAVALDYPTVERLTTFLAVRFEVNLAFADVLDILSDTVAIVDRFDALGCDSRTAIQVGAVLRGLYPALPTAFLFEHTSVSELIRRIVGPA